MTQQEGFENEYTLKNSSTDQLVSEEHRIMIEAYNQQMNSG